MKCARFALRVAPRVDFRGPATARAPDRLFMLPSFPPLAERCAFDRGGVDGQSHAILAAAGERFKDRLPMSTLGPAIEPIVDRRVGTIVGRAIAPACAALKQVNDTADDASIVIARWAGLVRWQMRLYLTPLLVVEANSPLRIEVPHAPQCLASTGVALNLRCGSLYLRCGSPLPGLGAAKPFQADT